MAFRGSVFSVLVFDQPNSFLDSVYGTLNKARWHDLRVPVDIWSAQVEHNVLCRSLD